MFCGLLCCLDSPSIIKRNGIEFCDFSRIVKYVHFSISLLLLQACGLHNQVMNQGQLLKDRFACFTSFANEGYSYIATSNATYGSVTKIKIIFQSIKSMSNSHIKTQSNYVMLYKVSTSSTYKCRRIKQTIYYSLYSVHL